MKEMKVMKMKIEEDKDKENGEDKGDDENKEAGE